jgi:hypothetical protein
MAHTDQLPVPDEAVGDPQSFEILRVWIANEGQHVSLRSCVWDDPFAYGILLADLARHVANAYHQGRGLEPEIALRRIREGLDAELTSPTDDPSGAIES